MDLGTADIIELQVVGSLKSTFVPIMDTNAKTLKLAMAWATTLAKFSGKSVAVIRNGAKMIDVPPPKQ